MSYVIGTAGHIDHGKTALVHALTGCDTDRLKEEKERGISIDLGFAHLDLANGERVGVIDVPGHERFIRNMLAGAHGIDLVLLVVAADDGVMPQTAEHLDILHVLGVEKGVVVVSKADLVDAVRLQTVREEIALLLQDTALQDAPFAVVSSTTGAGIDVLRHTIERQLQACKRRPRGGLFRMPIDRAFVMHGHGVVATGTTIAGVLAPEARLRLLPNGDVVRVRGIQVHGIDVPQAQVGQRVALNLAGLERGSVSRGDVLCDTRLHRLTQRLDVRLLLRGAGGRLANHAAVRVYLGAAEALGKVVLLGRDSGGADDDSYAQLVLRQPLHALYGDRFVVRDHTAQRTLGGGMVLQPFARRHRRNEPELAGVLQSLWVASDERAVLQALLLSQPGFVVSVDDLLQASGLDEDVIRAALRDTTDILALPSAEAAVAYASQPRWQQLRHSVQQTLAAWHAREPSLPGLEMESLRTQLLPDLAPQLYRALLDALQAQAVLLRAGNVLRLPEHGVRPATADDESAQRIVTILSRAGVTPPDAKELERTLPMEASQLRALLQRLERDGRVAKVAEGMYYAPAALHSARQLLRQYIAQHGSINAAAFRDLLGASRKFSIALLDYFDRSGFTMRVGDLRKLRR